MRIGEVSRRSGVSVRMLRHYDALGLVRPHTRTATGYRDYSAADVRRILHVEALRSLGMGLAEVAEALKNSIARADSRDTDSREPSPVLEVLIDRTRARIEVEQELLERLEHTRSRSPEDWEDALRTVALLRAVRSDDPRERQRAALAPDAPLPAAALAEAALTEDETNTAGAVRWALARAAERGEDPFVAVDDALASASERTRRRAVGVLADLPGAEATTRLTRTLADDDAEVRAVSALALASRIGDLSGSEEAAAAPDRIRDELVRMIIDGTRDVEAAEALARVVSAEATTTSAVVAVLRDRLHDGGTPAAGRQRAVQALGELRGPRVDAALGDLTDDADPAVARIAAYLAQRRRRECDEAHGEGTPSGR